MMSRLPRPTGSVVAAAVALLWIGAIVAIGYFVFFQDRSEPVDIVEIVGRSDSTELILKVRHPACETPRPDVEIEEGDAVIGLSARYDASGSCNDIFVDSTVAVTLDEPLGSRRIESKAAADDGRSQVCLIDDVPSTRCSQT